MRRRPDGSPGAMIRQHRRAAGLTQRQLAQSARVSIGVVRDLEQGLTGWPHAETARRLAAALGLSDAAGLRIGVLGPVTAWRDGLPVALGSGPQRALLGLLALHAGTAVHRDALIDALWGHEPPAAAVGMVQCYVSRLRRLLDPGQPAGLPDRSRITSGSAGYALRVAGGELDRLRFGQLAGHARQAHVAGDARAACALYEQALGLWRGEPLAGVTVLASHPEVIELGCQRTELVLGYADAAACAGRPGRVLRPLRAAHHRDPLDERVAGRLMTALAASGCQARALAVYDEVRRRLDEQLGIYPSAELAAAHARVLRQQFLPAAAAAGGRAVLRAV